jgi:DNA topoisomerase VI subunit B
MTQRPILKRETFTTSRLLEFTSQKELELQTGMPAELWALLVLKELTDNAIDACEEAKVAPKIAIHIDSKAATIRVGDNGPGIPASTVASVVDFATRTSSREAYASPTRGAQGNALKTVLAMPFACGEGQDALTEFIARGVHHTVTLSVDAVRQEPVVRHTTARGGRGKCPCLSRFWFAPKFLLPTSTV